MIYIDRWMFIPNPNQPAVQNDPCMYTMDGCIINMPF
jgi:hypothetical protein